MSFSCLLSYRLPTYHLPTYLLTYLPYLSSLYLLFVCSHGSCALHIINPVAWLNVHSKKNLTRPWALMNIIWTDIWHMDTVSVSTRPHFLVDKAPEPHDGRVVLRLMTFSPKSSPTSPTVSMYSSMTPCCRVSVILCFLQPISLALPCSCLSVCFVLRISCCHLLFNTKFLS